MSCGVWIGWPLVVAAAAVVAMAMAMATARTRAVSAVSGGLDAARVRCVTAVALVGGVG